MVCVCERGCKGPHTRASCVCRVWCILHPRYSALAEVRRYQAQSAQCPQLKSDNCSVFSECDGVTCQFRSQNQSSVATVHVEKCVDPVAITLSLFGGGLAFSNDFTSSASVVIGALTFTLNTSRNASYVDVQVLLRTFR